jgi:ketosteroid isomerase-like protein
MEEPMSNADVVRSFYEGIEGGNLPAALDLLAPDVAWTEMAGFPYAGTYHGPDAVVENVFARIGSEWDGFRFDLDEVVDGGDTVVGVGTYSATCKATGRPMQARVVHVWKLRDGKATAFEQFADTLKVAEALER